MIDTATRRGLEHWFYNYRRTWRGTVVSSLLNPFMYLAAMGLGLGSLVDSGGGSRSLAGGDYLAFIAPGLLAATAMQVAAGESTFPVLGSIKWDKKYHAMLASPLGVGNVLAGQLWWIGFRIVTTCAVYLAVIGAFGAADSPLVLLALPAAVLTGMAFAAPIVAFVATQERETSFNALFRFGMVPLFLFSGTFFPVSQLPAAVRPIAYATPLWHGVELCRGLSLGTVTALGGLGNVAYLSACAVAGVLWARRTFRRRLVV